MLEGENSDKKGNEGMTRAVLEDTRLSRLESLAFIKAGPIKKWAVTYANMDLVTGAVTNAVDISITRKYRQVILDGKLALFFLALQGKGELLGAGNNMKDRNFSV